MYCYWIELDLRSDRGTGNGTGECGAPREAATRSAANKPPKPRPRGARRAPPPSRAPRPPAPLSPRPSTAPLERTTRARVAPARPGADPGTVRVPDRGRFERVRHAFKFNK